MAGAVLFPGDLDGPPFPIALGAGVQISQSSGECAEAVLG
jgi:hypothetical protein